jgi:hypothetical protein
MLHRWSREELEDRKECETALPTLAAPSHYRIEMEEGEGRAGRSEKNVPPEITAASPIHRSTNRRDNSIVSHDHPLNNSRRRKFGFNFPTVSRFPTS